MGSSAFTSWLFPGQGSQYLGMGRDLWSRPGRALNIVEEAEDLSGFAIRQICLQGPADELTRTDVLQPALTAMALGCMCLLDDADVPCDMVAGHSLGEFPALCAARVITTTDCLRLVTARGRLMQKIAQSLDGGMGAVKRLAPETLESVISRSTPNVRIANFNSPDQIVVSGPNPDLALLAHEVTLVGGEFIALAVSGPWHHPSMNQAAIEFRDIVDQISFSTPRCPVYLNVSATAETEAPLIKAAVKLQMISPVLWHNSMLAMFAAGASVFLEVGPGKVLRGLMRRINPDESSYRIRGIENARSLQFLTTEMQKR